MGVHLSVTDVMGGRHEERLIDEIFEVRKYQKLARPVKRESEAVDVEFGLSLQQIIAVVSHSVCPSVCPSVCHAAPSNRFLFFVSRWNRAIFWPSSLHVVLYKMLFFDF